MNDKKEPKVEPKPKTQEDFIKAYDGLSKEYGFMIAAVPGLVRNHDGTFSIKVELQVAKI